MSESAPSDASSLSERESVSSSSSSSSRSKVITPLGRGMGKGIDAISTLSLPKISLTKAIELTYGISHLATQSINELRILNRHKEIIAEFEYQKAFTISQICFILGRHEKDQTVRKLLRLLVSKNLIGVYGWNGIAKRTFGVKIYYTPDATEKDIAKIIYEYEVEDEIRYNQESRSKTSKSQEDIKQEMKEKWKAHPNSEKAKELRGQSKKVGREEKNLEEKRKQAQELIKLLDNPGALKGLDAEEVRDLLDDEELLKNSTAHEMNRYAKILFEKGFYSNKDPTPEVFKIPVNIKDPLFHARSWDTTKIKNILQDHLGLTKEEAKLLRVKSPGAYLTTNFRGAQYYGKGGEVILELDPSKIPSAWVDPDPFEFNPGPLVSQQGWDQYYVRGTVDPTAVQKVWVKKSLLGKIDANEVGEYYVLSTDRLLSLLE